MRPRLSISAANSTNGGLRIGTILRAERESFGFTRRALSHASGVKQRTIESWESGEVADPPWGGVRLVALCFGASMDEWARIVRLSETDAAAAEQRLERLTGQGAEDGWLPTTDVRARHVA